MPPSSTSRGYAAQDVDELRGRPLLPLAEDVLRVVYRVSCADLGLPRDAWTKDADYQAANAWWLAKRAELDAPHDVHQEALAGFRSRIQDAKADIQTEGGPPPRADQCLARF